MNKKYSIDTKKIFCFIAVLTIASHSFCPIYATTTPLDIATSTVPFATNTPEVNPIIKSSPEIVIPDNIAIGTTIFLIGLGLSIPLILALLLNITDDNPSQRQTRPIIQRNQQNSRSPKRKAQLTNEEKEKSVVQKFSTKKSTNNPLYLGPLCRFPLVKTETKLEHFIGSKPKDIEIFIKQIQEPEKCSTLGCPIPQAILIEGPPGTGKKTIIRGLTNHVNAYLFELTGADLHEKWVGDSGKQVKEVLANARELAGVTERPVFVLIKKLDAAFVGINNEKGGNKSVSEEVLATLIDELSADGDKNKGITIFAMTDSADQLPESIVEIFQIISVNIPNEEDQKKIFKNFAEKYNFDNTINDYFYDIEIAGRIKNFSGKDIEKMLHLAVQDAFSSNQETITKENILEAIPKVKAQQEAKLRKSKFAPEKTNVTLDVLAGSKTPEIECLIDMFTNPEKYKNLNVSIYQAVLLYGPPGTGKTTLVKAIANAIGATFFSFSGSDITGRYIGTSKDNVNIIFKNARDAYRRTGKPSIVLFDEFDGALAGLGTHNNVSAQSILSKLKTELTEEEKNEGVYFFATSNHPNSFPQALTRPGRFIKIKVDLPNEEDRKQIFKKYAETRGIDDEVTQDEFYEEIARRTEGFSGADIREIRENAGRAAAFNGQETITKQNILDALEKTKKYVKKQAIPHKRKTKRYSKRFNQVNQTFFKKLLLDEKQEKEKIKDLERLKRNLHLII